MAAETQDSTTPAPEEHEEDAEVIQLQAQVAALQARVITLETRLSRSRCAARRQLEELAQENTDLKEQVTRLTAATASGCVCGGSAARKVANAGGAGAGVGTGAGGGAESPVVAVDRVARTLPAQVWARVRAAHNGKNVTCCDMAPCGRLIASGGVDRRLRLWWASFDAAEPVVVASETRFQSPVLCVKFRPRPRGKPRGSTPVGNAVWEVAVACMGGDWHLVRCSCEPGGGGAADGVSAGGAGTMTTSIVQSVREHDKYVNNVAWSPQGRHLVTTSYDRSITVNVVSDDTAAGIDWGPLSLQARCHLKGCATSCCFVPGVSEVCALFDLPRVTDPHLRHAVHVAVVSVLRSSCLVYYNTHTDATKDVPLIPFMSTAPAFNITHVDCSPRSGKLLAAATDGAVHFVYRTGTSDVVARLCGHSVPADMSSHTPRVAWSPDERFLVGNGGQANELLVWSVLSESIVAKLSGHTAMIRDVAVFPLPSGADTESWFGVVTASYDKTLGVWGPAVEKEKGVAFTTLD